MNNKIYSFINKHEAYALLLSYLFWAKLLRVMGAIRSSDWCMKQVKQLGELDGQVQLDTLIGQNLYAIGPVAHLRGEILLWNDTTYVSQVIEEENIVEVIPTVQAPFLVYASVKKWEEQPVIDQPVTTLTQLQQIIEQKVIATGGSLDQPLPFVLKGQAQKITYHVMNKPEEQTKHNPALHQQAKQFFTLENEEVTLLGFYSRQHEGVFTHHGSYTHVHVVNQNRSKMGHLDELNFEPHQLRLSIPSE